MEHTRRRLQLVWFHDGAEINSDREDVESIWHIDNGKGPMGWYDMIHVIHIDGTTASFPAHQCSGWADWKEPTQ